MDALARTLDGPEIEVMAKATRRRFTLEYKRRVVWEADACKGPGAVGALLRREGLYSSHLASPQEGPPLEVYTVGSSTLTHVAGFQYLLVRRLLRHIQHH